MLAYRATMFATIVELVNGRNACMAIHFIEIGAVMKKLQEACVLD